MSINTTKPIKAPGAPQSITDVTKESASRTGALAKSKRMPETSARVELSQAATALNTSGHDDIDIDRVNQIKGALERGELHLDASAIADALLANSVEQHR